jgi:predicted double-glycine peptidase
MQQKMFIILLICFLLTLSHFSAQAWPVKSYNELRYQYVRKQNTLSSCGPSSLATLFSEFYGINVSEDEIIELIKPYLDEEIEKLKEGEVPEGGVSMLDLKRVSKEIGIPARGYEIPREKLLGIMRKIKSPLLIYLEEPEDHFVLSIAGVQGRVLLADPTLGTRPMGLESLFDKWKGLVLAFSPGEEYGNRAHKITKELRQNLESRSLTENLAREFL